MNSYNSPETAKQYVSFLDSEDGKIQQDVLYTSLVPEIKKINPSTLLDAGCGTGWFAQKIKSELPHTTISGCDSAEPLISIAQKSSPDIAFSIADLEQPLPYDADNFDCIVVNMAMHDLEHPSQGFTNLAHTLKPGGSLFTTVPNPYYAYPVGVWKRGVIGRLLFQKPKLRLAQDPLPGTVHEWKTGLTSHYYPLPQHIADAHNAKLDVAELRELRSTEDSKVFNLHYQLFRFPLLLQLHFRKRAE